MLHKDSFTPRHPPTNPAAGAFVPKFIYRNPSNPDEEVEIKEEFFGSRKKLRIGILGAGISTLNFLHFLQEKIPAESVEVVVWEKNSDIGGVWLTTRYPGARCDVPGYLFQFSWREAEGSEFLPGAEETLKYLQTAAKERDFYSYMRFRREVVRASWTDDEAEWRVSIQDVETREVQEEVVDLFLDFHGPVSNFQINVEGLENFKGEVVHTANWKEGINLQDKRVALFGYGSSGVQIAPHILPQVSKLYTWFRHRTYINPPAWPQWAAKGGANFAYTEEQKELLQNPSIKAAYRQQLDEFLKKRFPGNVNGSELSIRGREAIRSFMKEKLAVKPELFDNLVPLDFDPGCRRATFSHGYIETLVEPKTTVFFGAPKYFTPNGFIDDNGIHHSVDIVIAATGYDQSHLPRYPTLVNGTPVTEHWSSLQTPGPPCYMAVCMASLPNYFHMSSAYAHVYGSWFATSEIAAKYIVQCVEKIQLERIKTLKVKDRAVKHFVRHANSFLQRMAQSGPCASWYKTEHGRPATWPGSWDCYEKALAVPRWEDFEIGYEDEGDLFSFLGNGFTERDGEVVVAVMEEILGKEGEGRPEGEVSRGVLEKLKGVYSVACLAPNLEQQRQQQAHL